MNFKFDIAEKLNDLRCQHEKEIAALQIFSYCCDLLSKTELPSLGHE